MPSARSGALLLPGLVVGGAALAIFEFRLAGLVTLAIGVAAGLVAARFATTRTRAAAIAGGLTVALAALAVGLFLLDCYRTCS